MIALTIRRPLPFAAPFRRVVLPVALALSGVFLLRAVPVMLAPGDAAAVWACGESLKVSPTQSPQPRNSVWTEAGRKVQLPGARGEYFRFQVVLRPRRAPLNAVGLRPAPLGGPGGATLARENIALRRQH